MKLSRQICWRGRSENRHEHEPAMKQLTVRNIRIFSDSRKTAAAFKNDNPKMIILSWLSHPITMMSPNIM